MYFENSDAVSGVGIEGQYVVDYSNDFVCVWRTILKFYGQFYLYRIYSVYHQIQYSTS